MMVIADTMSVAFSAKICKADCNLSTLVKFMADVICIALRAIKIQIKEICIVFGEVNIYIQQNIVHHCDGVQKFT